MAISVRDFGNFKNTIRKSELERVVYHTVFLNMGNEMSVSIPVSACIRVAVSIVVSVSMCVFVSVSVMMGVVRVSHPRPLPPPLSFSSLSLSGFHERAGTWRNKLAR